MAGIGDFTRQTRRELGLGDMVLQPLPSKYNPQWYKDIVAARVKVAKYKYVHVFFIISG